MALSLRFLKIDQAHPVGQADLFERPACARVADETTREVGHPSKGGDDGLGGLGHALFFRLICLPFANGSYKKQLCSQLK